MLSSCFHSFAKQPNLPRTHIAIVGFMNAGKSSIMNSITQQPTSIVDNTPGTTADTKISLMEIHKIGPCKLIDTAGIDEIGTLGQKKLEKTLTAIKESDIMLTVVDPYNFNPAPFDSLFNVASRRGKKCAIVFNKFNEKGNDSDFSSKSESALAALNAIAMKYHQKSLPHITVVAKNSKSTNNALIPFISTLKKTVKPIPPLPPQFLGKGKTILLNIPLDIESPSGRLLRPQQMLLEASLRKGSSVLCFNMDLKAARGKKGNNAQEAEKRRFLKQITNVNPSLLITDSQAIDVMHKWTPLKYPLTTFSVAMANIQSGGKLRAFSKGIQALGHLKPEDRVLICEACNHDRIGDDIGTVQLPTKLKKIYPKLKIDWAFGRAYEDKKLKDYALAFHCGGCMISKQQMMARIQDLLESGVPVVNYGLALSWLASPNALERVLKPWQ